MGLLTWLGMRAQPAAEPVRGEDTALTPAVAQTARVLRRAAVYRRRLRAEQEARRVRAAQAEEAERQAAREAFEDEMARALAENGWGYIPPRPGPQVTPLAGYEGATGGESGPPYFWARW